MSLSPQMTKLLSLMSPDRIDTVSSVEEKFYGMPKGSYGYVNRGRGGGLTATSHALERRGLAVRDRHGWRLPTTGPDA